MFTSLGFFVLRFRFHFSSNYTAGSKEIVHGTVTFEYLVLKYRYILITHPTSTEKRNFETEVVLVKILLS
jgi:hypothetical protein